MNGTSNGAGGFDDDELAELQISLAPSANRRANNKPPNANAGQARSEQGASGSDAANKDFIAPEKRTEARIGQYVVKKTLGEGSFGKVKLATHRVTGQDVALKIIARKKLISRDMAGRVEREIEYLQLLRHPHIIKLYTVIKTPTEIVMVLEFAGGELFDYIVQNGKMREDEARRFFQQIICAVEYCHRHKIVHRDLKPENLLLDENLNVKIADFGLSNIMTDGNFLKTSCGSPNYAAPEVINGKLYAGPEVDVWSCGVILYVLLVGRLPFDDEHIPSLFAKIAKGLYVVPNYMGAGAAALIKKCLAVNPVHRATIDDIRLDPWFMKNLPVYLQRPPEEFLDTGVDPTKAINPRSIAPNATPAVQNRLHAQVTEKISKTMGYGIKDVQEALAADEPSAIKDAYMIVRENKLMEANPNLADDRGQLLFQTSSPPVWNDNINNGNGAMSSPGGSASSPFDPTYSSANPESSSSPTVLRPNPLLDPMSPRSNSSIGTDKSAMTPRPYVSKIGILASSIPSYHRAFMHAKKSGKPLESNLSTTHSEDHEPHAQTDAEKAETARRLNPHSRSQIKLDQTNKVPGLTALPTKKNKPTKWQFGIRSRNQPLDAISCIYRALKALGAEWLLEEDDSEFGIGELGIRNSNDNESSGASLHHTESMPGSSVGASTGNNVTFKPVDSVFKLPNDPWILHVRWKKDGLYPPGMVPPGSTHSSTIDVRRQSVASLGSAGSSLPNHEASSPSKTIVDDNVIMHVDIQLYEMEQSVYLVDFKCSGYEMPDGSMLEEKDITSPFPFLDLASKLIIQLAEAE